MPHSPRTSFFGILWDAFCTSSIIGIWPRFIEPNLIRTTRLTLPVQRLPSDLSGIKVLQFSDLHIRPGMPDAFLKRLSKKIAALSPDIIVFTGDFLCYAAMTAPQRLQKFLAGLSAPYGCFAVLGNHDYAACVSINEAGEYDVMETSASSLSRAFKRLGTTTVLKEVTTARAQAVPLHNELVSLLAQTPFQLLHNACRTVPIKQSKLNICGLGEYMLGQARPQEAFQDYDDSYPGIVLLHNPDGIRLLHNYPGDIVLSGHTHGGQVNLPWMWRKFTLLENMGLKKGLVTVGNKRIYVNRGIGSVLPFRWFSPPELTLLTLEPAP